MDQAEGRGAASGRQLTAAQRADRIRVISGFENESASDENVGAVLDREAGGLGVDSAIDFDLVARV